MNVLLLGSFGFIGTNIVKYIDNHNLDISVIAFDRFSEHLDHIQFNSISRVYSGDFSDEHLLERVFDENDIDLVIHSLSASVPSLSQDNEFDLLYNVLPTIKLLNQMVRHNVKSLIFISSGGAIYGDHYTDVYGHVEEEVLFPKSAYGISKLVIEKYLYLYFLQEKVNSLVLRLSNPYGPYHYSQKQGIINIVLERAIQSGSFEIWGDGNGKKDYIYIEDFCEILMKLVDNWRGGYDVINVGSDLLLSVNEIVEVIKKKVNSSFVWSYKSANLLDVQDFKLNLKKMKDLIGDFYFTSLEEGIDKTQEWLLRRS